MTFGLSAAAIGGIAAGAGAIGGAIISGNAAEDAAATQAGSAGAATAAQERMFNKQLDLQAPWRTVGQNALMELQRQMGIQPQAKTADQLRAELTQQFTTGGGGNGIDDVGLNAEIQRQMAAQGGSRLGGYVPQGTTREALLTELSPMFAAPGGNGVDDTGLNAEISRILNQGAPGALAKPFGMADFTADPGYQFRQDEQAKALTRAGQAQGGLGSGKYLKDAMKYSGNLAAGEYGNAFSRFTTNQNNLFSRLSGIAGIGQGATNQTTAAAGNYGQQVGSNIIGAGNALAAGQVGGANAWNNAIGQGLSLYQTNSMLNRVPYDTGAGISPPNPYYLG